MHLLRGVPNPGLPVGNPLHALNEGLILPSSNIMERRRGDIGPPQVSYNCSFNDDFEDDFLQNLLSSPRQESETPSTSSSDNPNAVLVTPPPKHQPFVPRKSTQDLYSWFSNSPNFEDF